MASKSAQDHATTPEAVEELLDVADKSLDRVKTLYEQYFLGIQKQPPTFLHTDIERKLRDLTQLQIRNTGLRYRLATLQQKFGSYNSYWKRTLRQIENGTYLRNLSKIGREAVRTGAEIPEEILAAMPKRMREQVLRDREQAIAIAERRMAGPEDDASITDVEAPVPAEPRRGVKSPRGPLALDEGEDDFDIDAFFDSVVSKEAPEPAAGAAPAAKPAPKPAAKAAPAPSAPAPAPAAAPQAAKPVAPITPPQVARPNPILPSAPAASGAGKPPGGAAPRPGALPKLPPIPIPAIPALPPRPAAKPAAEGAKPPPGMTDADVNVLYEKYVQAKQMVGETIGPDGRNKLLKTMNAQAPKIMEQYKAKGVEFSVSVKDNQVILKAKPKT